SRVGYDILEEKFSKGTLAPTTVILESENAISEEEQTEFADQLMERELVDHVRLTNITDNNQVIQYDLTFAEDPYDVKAIDALEQLIESEGDLLSSAKIEGDVYFAGET